MKHAESLIKKQVCRSENLFAWYKNLEFSKNFSKEIVFFPSSPPFSLPIVLVSQNIFIKLRWVMTISFYIGQFSKESSMPFNDKADFTESFILRGVWDITATPLAVVNTDLVQHGILKSENWHFSSNVEVHLSNKEIELKTYFLPFFFRTFWITDL